MTDADKPNRCINVHMAYQTNLWSVFPLSRFFSANRWFVGARANHFWQYSKHSFRKFDKFVEIWHLVHFNTGLAQNLGHINVFLGLWAQLCKENLGTRRLAIKLEGTQFVVSCSMWKVNEVKCVQLYTSCMKTFKKFCKRQIVNQNVVDQCFFLNSFFVDSNNEYQKFWPKKTCGLFWNILFRLIFHVFKIFLKRRTLKMNF